MAFKNFLAAVAILFIGICAGAVLLSDSAEGKTWYVDDDGGAAVDFERLQDAVNASEDGDTIRVWEGIYHENVVVNKTVSLIGNGSANTTIDGGGVGDVVRIEADWCNMSGFGIQNSGSSYWNDAGIELQADNTTIMANTISNNGVGIFLDSSGNTIITGNTILDNALGTILSSSGNTSITDNAIANNYRGIFLDSSSNTSIVGNTITGSSILNDTVGIYLSSSSNASIAGNTIMNNSYGILFSSSNVITITNNTIASNGDGIYLYSSGNTTIADTTISNNGDGIYLSSSSNTIITGNTISSNNDKGIYLHSSSSTTITGNTISNNDVGIYLKYLRYSSNNTVHLNNIVANTNYGIYVDSGNDSIVAEENWWGDESGPYHPEENQRGGGDNVSDFVDFSPWLNEDGEPVKDTNERSHTGVYCLLGSILCTLLALVVVVRLPDRYFKRSVASKSTENDQTPPQPPPQRLNTCPHCGGKFEVITQKRPVRFSCHFCGKEIEFE